MTSNSPASVGFLSPSLAGDCARIRADFSPWFDVAEDFNRHAMRVLPSLQPGVDSNDGLVVALLFGRALTTFQGVLILAERGMLGDARTLVRAASEAAIVLAAVVADPTVCEQLIDDHFRHLKKMRNAWLEDGQAVAVMSKEQVDAVRAALADAERDRPSVKGGNPMSLEPLSKIGGTLALYNAVYRSMSGDAAHVTADSLNRHALADADGRVRGLKLGPTVDGLADTLFGSMWTLAAVLEATGVFFTRPAEDGGQAQGADRWSAFAEERSKLVARLMALGDPADFRPRPQVPTTGAA